MYFIYNLFKAILTLFNLLVFSTHHDFVNDKSIFIHPFLVCSAMQTYILKLLPLSPRSISYQFNYFLIDFNFRTVLEFIEKNELIIEFSNSHTQVSLLLAAYLHQYDILVTIGESLLLTKIHNFFRNPQSFPYFSFPFYCSMTIQKIVIQITTLH